MSHRNETADDTDVSTNSQRTETSGVSRRAYLASAGAATMFASAGCAGNGGGGTPTINVITWNDFAQDSVVNSVEENLDVNVEITTSTSSTEMFQQMNQGADFDVAVPNNNLVPRFLNAELIEPVNMDAVTNYGDIYQKFRDFVGQQFTQDGNAYGVPIRWGWYGYAYDTRSVPDHEPSYNIMFEEDYVDADLDGELIMYDEAAKTMPVAALYLAEAEDDPSYREALTEDDRMTFSEEQISNMRDLLIDQKPSLEGYISSDTTFIQEFQQGNFLVGHSGRNEVVRLRENQGADWVEFVVPQEGAMAWYETAVVSQESDNTEAAWEVINEYIAPGTGAELARQGKSPSCNPNVADELNEEEQELYGRIDPERIEQFIPFKDIASDVQEPYNAAWEEVKA